MNLYFIDWFIVSIFLLSLVVIAVYAKQLNKGVADFLVANRCAGRYLLSISEGMSGLGAITFIAYFEMYYKAGFTAAWWMMITMPVGLIIALSGWVVYRYRETRAMTMAQFFEMRYSRNFRIFSGALAWISGVINMGIFPAVSAKFFLYFCGLPKTFIFLGQFEVSTFVLIMVIELSIALLFTLLGGMTVVVITDFFQGLFCNVAFLVIFIALFFRIDWNQIAFSLASSPESTSMINPFKAADADFNLSFFLIAAFTTVYSIRAWQGSQGFNAAAKNAHETKMAGIIGRWRGIVQTLLIMLLPICAYTLMHHSDFADQAQIVNNLLNTIESGQVREQTTVPLALTQLLPPGVLGLFCAVMFAAAISTDDTYLHSWGSIFIQDIILPLRKKSFSPIQHIRFLRLSIVLVAIIIFIFSLIFRQNDYIINYMMMTGAMYIGGAGVVIIGGLYWKHGSTSGAWCGMIIGCILAFGGLILRIIWPSIIPHLIDRFSCFQFLATKTGEFPYNGTEINFFAILCAIGAYVGVSLYSWLILKKPAFNLDRMLHRGKYGINGEHKNINELPPTGLRALLPSKEFSKSDKVIYFAVTAWTVGWFCFFVGVTIYHLIFGTSDDWWLKFWAFKIWITAAIGIITIVWFLIGGVFDLKYLFRVLRTTSRDNSDNGVVSHCNENNENDTCS